MSLHFLRTAALALLPLTPVLADPAVGAKRDEVLAELGQPSGVMAIGDKEELNYPRGVIVLDKGVVKEVRLLTPAEWEKKERRRVADAKLKAEQDARDAADLAERRRKGAEALNLLMADARWKENSGEGRVAVLEKFAKVFPDADIAAVKLAAEVKRDAELADKRRLQDLETRVAKAESRAGEAENRAKIAEVRAEEAKESTRRAEAAADAARQQDQFYGVRTGTWIGGNPYGYYPYYNGGSSVTIVKGGMVITSGGTPPGVVPRPIVIVNPPKPTPTPAPTPVPATPPAPRPRP